ncbi:hypothetical protein PV325_001463 [Microctonus aethiopoides]|nr:hypothetical protein PV325_001463 [Microctonus aethiopoides]KAK0097852.1 hypothetical protein PV326_013247 [Microctonus aethiopoides]
MNKTRSGMEKKTCQLPGWLWPTSNALPPLYKRIWEAVKDERLNIGELLVDTNKVFPLLLTSQLPTEVLGYIWSLANQKYAGQLTEQELYIVLALIAIAQTSYAFTNLDVLHMLPGPPIPRLNLTNLYSNTNAPQSSTLLLKSNVIGDDVDKHYDQKIVNDAKSTSDVYSTTTIIPSSIINSSYIGETRIDPKPSAVSAHKIIFDDRQSSLLSQETKLQYENTSSDLNDDFSEFQSAPIQSTPLNIPMWDSKQGSAIGSRLANHNLSSGKLIEKKKLSANKNNDGSNCIRKNSPLSSPVISSSNKDRLSEINGNLFSKCNIKNPEKTTVILKDTAIRNETLSQSQTINSRDINFEKFTDIPPIPKQLKSPVSKISEGSTQDLMSLQPFEDKYSALRILVEEPTTLSSAISSSLSTSPEPSDDFGDFVSAEKFEPITVDSIQSTVDTSLDLFSDFEQFLPCSGNDKSEISFTQETIEAFAQLEITASPEKTINFLEEKYEVTIDPEKVIQKEDAISINSIELNNGVEVLTRSNSVPSLDLKLFLPSNVDDEKEMENMHQLIYSEWKQYMESCVLLLQVSANIFMNITSDVVMQEVLNSAQGYNFLCNLAEVAAVCRRVNFSHKEMDINIMGFDDLLMDIDKIWAEMEPFYANIPAKLPAWPLHPSDGTTCALCLTIITSGKIVYNDNIYHLTCANLWLNCVNSNLPALRYIPSHTHSIIAGIGSNSGQL